jgi:hypothetical protein
MERLFSTCTRYQDVEQSRRLPYHLRELHLDVSIEAFLSAEKAFTYADLYAILENDYTVAWLIPDTIIGWDSGRSVRDDSRGRLDESCPSFCFEVDEKRIYAVARSSEKLLEICDVLFRLLAAGVVRSIKVLHWWCPGDVSVNATSLANLLEQCQSLKVLTFDNVNTLDEDQIRVLGAFSRPGLEIILALCEVTRTGASALGEVLGRNQGPTKLLGCEIDNFLFADGLRGNSRLKCLEPIISRNSRVANRELLTMAGALRDNRGLVNLHLALNGNFFKTNDETWCAVCDSLQKHPTLQILNLQSRWTFELTPAVFRLRIEALVDMMKVNMSIHTITLADCYCEHELFRRSVIPYLETNRLRPRIRAIQATRPMTYRAKILGRALAAARTDANSLWMFLSGNPEVAFPSTTTPVSAVAASATVGATTTVNVGN